MIDVVYPIMNASKYNDDWELRYSLRSLQQQNWVRNIYLVGHCPDWIQNITHITCSDPYVSCKDANIINKIMLACHNTKLSDNFIVNSDDQYILKPIATDDLAPMLENPNRLSEFKAKAGTNSWHKRVVDTVDWCVRHGQPNWILQSHVPYIVNKNDYIAAMSQLPWGRGNGFTTHVYFNIVHEQIPAKEPVGRTLRIKGRSVVDFDNAAKQATFFNHNDSGFIPQVRNFLESHFSVKSKWEK
jgi:hypothetical protein